MDAHFSTAHHIFYKSARSMAEVPSNSVAAVVTSPPYPMIEMWDDVFARQDPKIAALLGEGNGIAAFKRMHALLQPVWEEIFRVLVPGGVACINIGDATRTIAKTFQLYPSHAEIISRCQQIGFQSLPEILWRKETNSPTKFMGSGMLPPNAYVTLEHEYILLFRKGEPRKFGPAAEKDIRRASAYFWEERNQWFSDLWAIKGTGQNIQPTKGKMTKVDKNSPVAKLNLGQDRLLRERSGAFPFEIAFRLINMFSIQGDTILDPFLGTGTTSIAALVSGRGSIGYEINPAFAGQIAAQMSAAEAWAANFLDKRLHGHKEFVAQRIKLGKPPKYTHDGGEFDVVTNQERRIRIPRLVGVTQRADGHFVGEYRRK